MMERDTFMLDGAVAVRKSHYQSSGRMLLMLSPYMQYSPMECSGHGAPRLGRRRFASLAPFQAQRPKTTFSRSARAGLPGRYAKENTTFSTLTTFDFPALKRRRRAREGNRETTHTYTTLPSPLNAIPFGLSNPSATTLTAPVERSSR